MYTTHVPYIGKFSCCKIFVCEICVKKISWLGINHEKFLTIIFTHVKWPCTLQWCMRGYHIYQEEWEAAISEELQCEREKKNAKDPYICRGSSSRECCRRPLMSDDSIQLSPVMVLTKIEHLLDQEDR